jgi:hypothetical protein
MTRSIYERREFPGISCGRPVGINYVIDGGLIKTTSGPRWGRLARSVVVDGDGFAPSNRKHALIALFECPAGNRI